MGVLSRELPVHGRTQSVAVAYPGLDLGSQHGLACDVSVQALRGKGTRVSETSWKQSSGGHQLDFQHILQVVHKGGVGLRGNAPALLLLPE